MSDIPSSEIKKPSRIKGVFYFCLKFALWTFAVIVAIVTLLISMVFYFHFNAYGNARFDKAEWLLEADKNLQDGDRCSMAGTIVEDVLKPGMTRREVEDILGPKDKPYFVREDFSMEYSYYLGWCSPMAWDPDSLIVRYSPEGILLESYNIQH